MAKFKPGDVVGDSVRVGWSRIPLVILSIDFDKYVCLAIDSIQYFEYRFEVEKLDECCELTKNKSEVEFGKKVFAKVLGDILET